MSVEMRCPYPECDARAMQPQTGVKSGACGCAYGLPVQGCARCGMVNREGAAYCRRCGSESQTVSLKVGGLVPSDVELAVVKGRFRRPPVAINGMLYALAIDGALHQLSPQRGASARIVGEVGARGAGCNRGAWARIADPGSGVHGWTYLAASKDGIVAVPLATGIAEMLDEARPGEEISANRSEAEATGFRGVIAGDDFYGYASATSDGDFVLTIKGFSRERPALRPLAVHGTRLAGPVLHDGLVVMCTEEEAGIYDVAARVELKMAIPEGFTTLLRPTSAEMSVAPGSIPMTGTRGRDGSLRMTIAGVRDGVAGTLELDAKRKTSDFQRRPAGTSFYSNPDGSLSVSALNHVERIGREALRERVSSLQAGMAAYAHDGIRLWFAEQDYKGAHRVLMSRGTQTMEVTFFDLQCTKDTCCGINVVGANVVITYLSEDSGDGAGLRLARWTFE